MSCASEQLGARVLLRLTTLSCSFAHRHGEDFSPLLAGLRGGEFPSVGADRSRKELGEGDGEGFLSPQPTKAIEANAAAKQQN